MATEIVLKDGQKFTEGLWTSLLNGEQGDRFGKAGDADRSVQVTGTFGAGGQVDIEGSNDGTTWFILKDFQGNLLNVTANGIFQVAEITKHIRPNVVSGDGTTALKVVLIASTN